MKNTLITSLLVLISLCGYSQISENFTIYFDLDKHTLKQESIAQLDTIVHLYNTKYVWDIKLTAHTDQDASNSYNKKLSERRATSVSEYLNAHQIRKNILHSTWQGENAPAASNSTKEGKTLNRRVEIVVQYKPFSSTAELMNALKDDEQQFIIPTSEKYTITAKNGSEVTIPKDAFIDASGKIIPNNGVLITIDEALSAKDGLTNELVTESQDGQMLESGGMIKITASWQGNPLYLANNKELTVDLPTAELKDDMTVFTGSYNNDGLVRWNNTKTDFKATKVKKEEAPLILDVSVFQKYINNVPAIASMKLEEAEMTFPSPPTLPQKPREPRLPKKVKPENAVTGIAAWFTSDAKKVEIAANLDSKKYEEYLDQYARYEDKKVRYEQAQKDYKQAYTLYENKLEKLSEEINNHLITLDKEYKRYKGGYDQYRINQTIVSIEKINQKRKFLDLTPEKIMRRLAQGKADYAGRDQLIFLARQISYYRLLNHFDAKFISENFVKHGKVSTAMMRKYWNKSNEHFSLDPTYSIQQNQLCEKMLADSNVTKMIEKAIELKLATDTENGIISSGAVDRYFTAGIRKLGWINCDRFNKSGKKVITKLAVVGVIGERLMVYVKKLRSLLSVNAGSNRLTTVSLPENEEAKAIHINLIDGTP